ncbi:hypothetical protein A3715_19200 [Oleiphilus sp. HI0009]|nr:hypothetical protein A3715_19200 [Oleiphilus sp. HI0009]
MLRKILIAMLLTSTFNAVAEINQLIEDSDIALSLEKIIKEKGLKTRIIELKKTPIDGLYGIRTENGKIFYTNNDSSVVISGDLIVLNEESGKSSNMTHDMRRRANQYYLDELEKTDYIEFKAHDTSKEAIAWVFTDSTCGYCRKLHSEIEELNKQNVTIRYLAYPRGGVNNSQHLENIWCAENNNDAMTRAKSGETLDNARCENPIKEHYEKGQIFGVSGTPSIIFNNGTMKGGYLPAQQLSYLAHNNKKR